MTTETRRAMAVAILDWHLPDSAHESGCALRCGYCGDDLGQHLADELENAGLLNDASETSMSIAISTKAVEAAARALYAEERNGSMGFDNWPDYDDADNVGREIFEDHARAALDAALPNAAWHDGLKVGQGQVGEERDAAYALGWADSWQYSVRLVREISETVADAVARQRAEKEVAP